MDEEDRQDRAMLRLLRVDGVLRRLDLPAIERLSNIVEFDESHGMSVG